MCPWIVTLGENDTPGIFNAAGPASKVDRSGLMWGLRAMTAAPVTFYWPDQELLDELGIDMPMMSPGDEHFVNTASMDSRSRLPLTGGYGHGYIGMVAGPGSQSAAAIRAAGPAAEQEAAAIKRLKVEGG